LTSFEFVFSFLLVGHWIDRCFQSDPANFETQVPLLISQSIAMTNELLALCDYKITDDSKILTMKRHFPKLAALGGSSLIIPLQESLNASLPATSSSESLYQPFPINSPTFESEFVMVPHRVYVLMLECRIF
jgi:serine/threonine-protein kinase ATR